MGWDGVVDERDIEYCCRMRQNGLWSNISQALLTDLSCDMNGDLLVDAADIGELVEAILGTRFGDVNLDGVVSAVDRGMVLASINDPKPCILTGTCGWGDGDMNCDGVVDALDLEALPASADFDGDGDVDLQDFLPIHDCLGGPDVPTSDECAAYDLDGDGDVDLGDLAMLQEAFSG